MAGNTLPSFVNNRAITGNGLLCNRLLRHRIAKAKTLYSRNLVGHYGCVNAIEFSNNGGQLLASGGDDRRILIWNIQEALSKDREFTIMKGEHHSNIFSLAFDSQNCRVYSGGNDDQVLVHDIHSKETVDVFLHEDAVYGLAVDPRDSHVFTSACADGRVLLWDTRVPSSTEPFVIANYQTAFYAVVYHPTEPQFVATANSKEGVALWDIRAPRTCLVSYGSAYTQQNAMSVRFNQLGTRLVALRRRLPPVVYNVHSSAAAVQFNHSGYYNSCTMKSCTFAGDKDQYVLSGSDDFNLYMWEVPEPSEDVMWVGEAKFVLQGHRSIVNQVRFNAHSHNIVSSGVEKVIKLWSPFNFPNTRMDNETPRAMFSHQQYIDLVINSGAALSHDYTDQSMEEDPRMIAFFDSLVQREVNRSFSDSDDSDMSPESLYLHFAGEGDNTDSDESDSDSRSSISSARASIVRQMEENAGNGPTSQLRTLWNLASSATTNATSATVATVGGSSSESARDSQSSRLIRHQEGILVRHSDEVASSSGQPQPGGSDTQRLIPPDSKGGGTSKRKLRQRSSSSATPDSLSSSEDEVNFMEVRANCRLLRRFLKKKKKVDSAALDDEQQPESQEQVLLDSDRFINLQQRIAISKILQQKVSQSEERPGASEERPGASLERPRVSEERPEVSEDGFAFITEHLRQRNMATQQRLIISRMRQRILQENSLDTSSSQAELEETSRETASMNGSCTNMAETQGSCSTADQQTHARTSLLVNANNHSPVSPASDTQRNASTRTEMDRGVNSHSHTSTKGELLPRCSFETPNTNNSACTPDRIPEDKGGSLETTGHPNQFHKFKTHSARAKRVYRSRKEKQPSRELEESDSDY